MVKLCLKNQGERGRGKWEEEQKEEEGLEKKKTQKLAVEEEGLAEHLQETTG